MDRITKIQRKHYTETFIEHGANAKGVDWNDENKAELRHKIMLNLVTCDLLHKRDNEIPSLLDVGCGYGEFWSFIKKTGNKVTYTGIDVVYAMIDYAKNNFDDATFVFGDFFELNSKNKYDYIVCNGILTQKLDAPAMEMDIYAAKLIKKMYSLSLKGVAFNVMTTKVNYFDNNLYYRCPSELLAWCVSEITPYVRLDHSYPLYEYTMYLFREPRRE